MKNTQKHTQGPWHVAFYGETERPVIKHGNQSIADVRGCELDDSTSHYLANARLIAAAPDLLAALSSMYCAGFWSADTLAAMPDHQRNAIEAARAAIVKAEGVK